MGHGTALAAGAVLGVRHALEADHLAAVATLVDGDGRSEIVGASWGIGHSIPIAGIGLLFVTAGVRLPTAVTRFFEVVVGVALLFLGARMLRSAVAERRETVDDHDAGSHDHDATSHTHTHTRLAWLGGHADGRLDGDSFLVGVVHGFAGSGVLVVALVSTAPTVPIALSFLVGFSVLSIATMATVSSLWGLTVETRFTALLRGVAGLVGVAVGTVLLAEQFAVGPF